MKTVGVPITLRIGGYHSASLLTCEQRQHTHNKRQFSETRKENSNPSNYPLFYKPPVQLLKTKVSYIFKPEQTAQCHQKKLPYTAPDIYAITFLVVLLNSPTSASTRWMWDYAGKHSHLLLECSKASQCSPTHFFRQRSPGRENDFSVLI